MTSPTAPTRGTARRRRRRPPTGSRWLASPPTRGWCCSRTRRPPARTTAPASCCRSHVPKTGNFKVLVLGALANVVNLGGYSAGQTGAGAANNVSAVRGHQVRDPGRQPVAQVDFQRGFTGTSTAASNCCTTIDPTAVTAAKDYDYVVVFTGIDSGFAAEDKDRADLVAAGPAGPADRAGRGRQPEHDRRDAGRSVRRLGVRADDLRARVELLQRPAPGRGSGGRAARHLQPERPPARDLLPERQPAPADQRLQHPAHRRPPTAARTCTSTARSPTRSGTA